jgi:ribonuclease BN (tRNA processing enzyme)
MIKLKLLGCNGGIGGIRRTTCYALDESVLIDAGTGLISLSLEEMSRIEHVVITHAHFDHIASLPLSMDSVIGMRTGPINDISLRLIQTRCQVQKNVHHFYL